VIVLRTEKSQGEITVNIPILPILQRTLDAGPTGELAFICGTRGKPFSKESFGNSFKDACKAAGLPNCSAHGCRKIAATRAAEAGASVRSSTQSSAGKARQWRRCTPRTPIANVCRLEQWRRCKARAPSRTKLQHSIPSPDPKVRELARKTE